MIPELKAKLSERTGLVYVEVPSTNMWDLVEYLSTHRVAVSYEYGRTHFVVCFLRKNLKDAQVTLNEWAQTRPQAK